MTTYLEADVRDEPPAGTQKRPRPRRVTVEFVREALTDLLQGAERTGLSNGDFPAEAMRAINTLLSWEDRGFRLIARGADGREIPLSPVMRGVRPPGA